LLRSSFGSPLYLTDINDIVLTIFDGAEHHAVDEPVKSYDLRQFVSLVFVRLKYTHNLF
jgi:hypothetical protein